jgi:SAM-dependent methyltransferase
MTTLPSGTPGQPPSASPASGYSPGGMAGSEWPSPEEVRQVAEGFGADAGRYDRARPSYPADLIDRIVAASPGRDVLDAGCGTGIAARLFAAAGCRVLGVEPDPRMAEVARQLGTEAEVATIEEWDPAGRSFDTVTAAQAWHWVDPVAGAAKAAAVLRPGGRLAVFWNVFQPPQELRTAFAGVFSDAMPGSPAAAFWAQPALDAYRRLNAGRAADGIRAAGAFGDPEEWVTEWERRYTTGEWLDLVPTTGGFSRLPEAARARVLAGLGAAVDAAGGAFTMGYATLTVTAARPLA